MPSKVNETKPLAAFPGSSFKYTPLRHVRVLFIKFVQGLFAAAPHGHYRWDADEEKSEIIIRNESTINVDVIGKRPAINFTMGSVQFYSLGIDDLYTYDFDIDRKVKVVLVPGTMSINVCSRVDIECHDLAWVIAEHFWLLREMLMKAGFFEIGRGIQISPPSPAGSVVAADQGDEWFCSSLSVPFQFNRKSAFTPLGDQIAKNIRLNLTTQEQRLIEEGRGGPALAGHEFALRADECMPESWAPGASDARGKTPDPAGVRTGSLPLVPHPLNPAKLVTVQTVRPFRASGLRPFSRGPVLPLVRACVEESK